MCIAELNDYEEKEPLNKGDEQEVVKVISQKLSDLVNYIEPIKFLSFNDLVNFENKGEFYQMSSLGELKATALFLHPDTAKTLVKYNSRQISRIYPGALRQDSSNLNPILAWNSGCQMGRYSKLNLSKNNITKSKQTCHFYFMEHAL